MTRVDPLALNIRCVNDKSVPLPFDILLRGLLSYIQPVKLQLSGHFLLTFEDHQWHLPIECTTLITIAHTHINT